MRPIPQKFYRLQVRVQQRIFRRTDIDEDQSSVRSEHPACFAKCAQDIVPMMCTVPSENPVKASVFERELFDLTCPNRKVVVPALSSFAAHNLDHLRRQVIRNHGFSKWSGREAEMPCPTAQI